MKIGYLVPEFPGQTHAFFWREIQALLRQGLQVYPISTRKPSPLNCRHEFAPQAATQTHYLFPPHLVDLATWLAKGSGGVTKALAYIRNLEADSITSKAREYGLLLSAVDLVRWAKKNRIDHIHSHSCGDSAHIAALCHRMDGPPYSLTLHGDLDVYGTNHSAKMRDGTFVFVVGDHLRRQIVERVGIPLERVVSTFMGVNTSELAILGADRSYTAGELHIVTVARLHPAKGHIHALMAIQTGRSKGLNLHYTIAGEGPHRDSLIAQTKDLELQRHVTFTGTLAESEVYQLLSRADAFVLPSSGIGEAWPVSVMEAMGAGLPVIASRIGATPEMITSDKDGFLVPQGDTRALLDKITLLAANLGVRRRIGEAARKTAKERFDIAVSARILLDAITGKQRPITQTPECVGIVGR